MVRGRWRLRSRHPRTLRRVHDSGEDVIRALIADADPVTREGMRTLLELSGRDAVMVVGEAASGEEAVLQVVQLEPDVVFMDVRMPGISGIEATKQIRKANPVTKVILITIDDFRGAISEAIQAGVSGYMVKDASSDALVDAARQAVDGRTAIHPHLNWMFIEKVMVQPTVDPHDLPLSMREREILQMVAGGSSTGRVARDLGISPDTVKTHLEHIFEVLGANSRPDPPPSVA